MNVANYFSRDLIKRKTCTFLHELTNGLSAYFGFVRVGFGMGLPHLAWGQYYALGTDLALGTTPSSTTPLLRRLDTRQVELEDYVVEMEIGRGRVILTTLRLDGGLGDQPSGITRSPAGTFLLTKWVRYLQEPLGFHFGFI